jgi:hypothetical protein
MVSIPFKKFGKNIMYKSQFSVAKAIQQGCTEVPLFKVNSKLYSTRTAAFLKAHTGSRYPLYILNVLAQGE